MSHQISRSDFADYTPSVPMASDSKSKKQLVVYINPHCEAAYYCIYVSGQLVAGFQLNELDKAINAYNNLY